MPAAALRFPNPPAKSTRWLEVPEVGYLVRVFPDGSMLARIMYDDGTDEPEDEAMEVADSGDVSDQEWIDAIRVALNREGY